MVSDELIVWTDGAEQISFITWDEITATGARRTSLSDPFPRMVANVKDKR